MKNNTARTFVIAMAYVGVIVGAGFASGQEVLQYFVAFGDKGIFGAILALILFAITGKAILELGNLFLANEHNYVLKETLPAWVAKAFDIALIISTFGIGFVMIAGAGANLHQQFGLPVWLGSILLTGLIILCGFLDVEKVTNVIGSITPFLVVFLTGISIYALFTAELDYSSAVDLTREVKTTLPHWAISGWNYVGMNIMTGFSMAIVIGGDIFNNKTASKGGFWGGIICGLLIILSTLALILQVDNVAGADMPMLTLVNLANPILGTVYAVIIFGMIFNTGAGVYYSFASRFAANNRKKFALVVIVASLAGLAISAVGFTDLISYAYPIIGAMGMALIAILVYLSFKYAPLIKEEKKLRTEAYKAIKRGDTETFDDLIAKSSAFDKAKFRTKIQEEK